MSPILQAYYRMGFHGLYHFSIFVGQIWIKLECAFSPLFHIHVSVVKGLLSLPQPTAENSKSKEEPLLLKISRWFWINTRSWLQGGNRIRIFQVHNRDVISVWVCIIVILRSGWIGQYIRLNWSPPVKINVQNTLFSKMYCDYCLIINQIILFGVFKALSGNRCY